jgi:peptidoglycan hydrolase-like protein with peptidoglycan-binding domain
MDLSPRFSRSTRLRQVIWANACLQQGETGEDVRVVQVALMDLGYRLPRSRAHRGLPDGDYGPETASVVAQFQADSGLAPDGIVGAATLNKLSERIHVLMAARRRELHQSVRMFAQYRARGRG